jgi:hypothetical protein
MMQSDCCGAEPSNLSDMLCGECLESSCFTEEFDDGDVIRHIPAEDFSEWLNLGLIDNNSNNNIMNKFETALFKEGDIAVDIRTGELVTIAESNSAYPWCITKSGNRISRDQKQLRLRGAECAPEYITTFTEPYFDAHSLNESFPKGRSVGKKPYVDPTEKAKYLSSINLIAMHTILCEAVTLKRITKASAVEFLAQMGLHQSEQTDAQREEEGQSTWVDECGDTYGFPLSNKLD